MQFRHHAADYITKLMRVGKNRFLIESPLDETDQQQTVPYSYTFVLCPSALPRVHTLQSSSLQSQDPCELNRKQRFIRTAGKINHLSP